MKVPECEEDHLAVEAAGLELITTMSKMKERKQVVVDGVAMLLVVIGVVVVEEEMMRICNLQVLIEVAIEAVDEEEVVVVIVVQ